MNYFGLTLTFSILLPAARLLGVDFTCPPEFQDGENILSCRINRTAITLAKCQSVQSSVTFIKPFTPHFVKCLTPSFNSSTCIHQKPASGNCWCNQSDGEIFEYVFVYSANRSQDKGAKLGCRICVNPKRPLDDTASPTCSNMSFASLVSQDSEDVGQNVVVYVVVPVVVAALIIVIVVLNLRRHRQPCKSCLQRSRENKRGKHVPNRSERDTVDKDAELEKM